MNGDDEVGVMSREATFEVLAAERVGKELGNHLYDGDLKGMATRMCVYTSSV